MLSNKNCGLVWVITVFKFFINTLLYTFFMCFLQAYVYTLGFLTQLAIFLYTPIYSYLTLLMSGLSPQTTTLTTTTIYLNLIIN